MDENGDLVSLLMMFLQSSENCFGRVEVVGVSLDACDQLFPELTV